MKLTNSNRIRKKLSAEFVGTFVLVFAGRGAIIINDLSGGTITHLGVAALFAGPISVASMNPARSLAPALLSVHLENLWIYLTAPFIGAALAVPLCRGVQADGCCNTAPSTNVCE